MKKSKHAFTMIELIFIIVVLGILAAVAIPKLAATRDDAKISKARADIASIRSAIVSERQSRLIRGDNDWIDNLSNGDGNLFTGEDANKTLLMYGIAEGSSNAGGWVQTQGEEKYTFYLTSSKSAVFEYDDDDGTFDCTITVDLCKKLVQ